MTSSIALLTLALATGTADGSRPRDFELGAVATTATTTGPTVGPDMAVSLGRPDLHLRVGMQVLGGPDRRLSPAGHRGGEVLDTGTLHMCAARGRGGFRVRLCGGGQIGTTHLRYRNFPTPGRRVMPWAALTGFGDLAIPLGRRVGLDADRVGLLLQGGAMVPVLGPAIVMRSDDWPPMIRLPRSVGLMMGAGIRVALR
ncbi:MAG: hypothetical protein H6712_32925 [Myxococcales bacterium]|nr:hypothetical protein [Myxococcales bacterium]MCB9718697.1 hypothetical protein [Myxococcales bacterium]